MSIIPGNYYCYVTDTILFVGDEARVYNYIVMASFIKTSYDYIMIQTQIMHSMQCIKVDYAHHLTGKPANYKISQNPPLIQSGSTCKPYNYGKC